MKRTMAKQTSLVLTKVAGFFVTTMSGGFIHMPEAPDELVAKKTD
jgi:hypothetical protein